MELKHHLADNLKQLRLAGIVVTLAARHRQALNEQGSYSAFLARLLEAEVERRAQKPLSLRVRRAALPSRQPLDSFAWSFKPTVNRQQVLELARGSTSGASETC